MYRCQYSEWSLCALICHCQQDSCSYHLSESKCDPTFPTGYARPKWGLTFSPWHQSDNISKRGFNWTYNIRRDPPDGAEFRGATVHMSLCPCHPLILLCVIVVWVPGLLLSRRCQGFLRGLFRSIPGTSSAVNPLEDSYQLHVMFAFPCSSATPRSSWHSPKLRPWGPHLSGALKWQTYLPRAFPQSRRRGRGQYKSSTEIRSHSVQMRTFGGAPCQCPTYFKK